MSDAIIRSYVARVEDVNPVKRTVVGKINTSAIDHYNTVIDPRGIDLGDLTRGYRANPVVLYEHGKDPVRGSLPVGTNGWIRQAIGPSGPELIAQTRFWEPNSKKSDEFTEKLYEMYAEGVMRGFSVNIVPLPEHSGPPTREEIRARPELEGVSAIYRKSRLAEYSLVAVPGNSETITIDMARSILTCVKRGLALPDALVARARALDAEQVEDVIEIITEPEPAPVALPPLGGRSYQARRDEILAQLRGLFDPAKLKADLQERADLARGRV
jgi:hypothetical protein